MNFINAGDLIRMFFFSDLVFKCSLKLPSLVTNPDCLKSGYFKPQITSATSRKKIVFSICLLGKTQCLTYSI